jgi:hypothetical protein
VVSLFGIDLNTIVLLVVAGMNLYTVITARQTNKNMALVEKATNSMKDALVAATARASHAEGMKDARHEDAITASNVAIGRLERENNKPKTP